MPALRVGRARPFAGGPGARRPAPNGVQRGTQRGRPAVTFDESCTPVVDVWCSDLTNRHQKMWQKVDDVRKYQRLPGVSEASCGGRATRVCLTRNGKAWLNARWAWWLTCAAWPVTVAGAPVGIGIGRRERRHRASGTTCEPW